VEIMKMHKRYYVYLGIMGKNIYVDGTVADQESLDYLKKLIEQEVPAKFTIVWWVEVETDGGVGGKVGGCDLLPGAYAARLRTVAPLGLG